jgi:hypothetical protein
MRWVTVVNNSVLAFKAMVISARRGIGAVRIHADEGPLGPDRSLRRCEPGDGKNDGGWSARDCYFFVSVFSGPLSPSFLSSFRSRLFSTARFATMAFPSPISVSPGSPVPEKRSRNDEPQRWICSSRYLIICPCIAVCIPHVTHRSRLCGSAGRLVKGGSPSARTGILLCSRASSSSSLRIPAVRAVVANIQSRLRQKPAAFDPETVVRHLDAPTDSILY